MVSLHDLETHRCFTCKKIYVVLTIDWCAAVIHALFGYTAGCINGNGQ